MVKKFVQSVLNSLNREYQHQFTYLFNNIIPTTLGQQQTMQNGWKKIVNTRVIFFSVTTIWSIFDELWISARHINKFKLAYFPGQGKLSFTSFFFN